MEKLGQTMMTILQLSDILTSYFSISGISLLLMVLRSLKMVDFQRHLDLTVRTLSRSSLDLLHFLIIFFISLFLSTMIGHVMLGTTEESLSSFDKGFNFHFEMMLGSSLDVVGRLFSDRSVVRGNVEYATLCVYSFAVPAYLLFVLLNPDSRHRRRRLRRGEGEPRRAGRADAARTTLTMAASYRYGRIMGTHPSYDALIRTLKAVRKSHTPASVGRPGQARWAGGRRAPRGRWWRASRARRRRRRLRDEHEHEHARAVGARAPPLGASAPAGGQGRACFARR
jgi:hypothetical protein